MKEGISMFGGVAATYKLYKMDGEPYKKGNYHYVKVIHPITKLPKEVRFYTDKAHAANSPKSPHEKPLYKLFGFNDEKDSIKIIREIYLTDKETSAFFLYGWLKGRNWKYSTMFGGCWYAASSEPTPPIRSFDRVELISLEDFQKEHERCKKTLA